MSEIGLIVVALAAIAYATLGKRLARTPLTAPILFLALGYAIAQTPWTDPHAAETALHLLAEAALIILLFLDASQIDLSQLKRQYVWPRRMLLFGLPLAIVLGMGVGYALLPDWPIAAIALVAALLAPTDAALGQSVVSNTRIPERVRRALTVESGLNDGLALPVILLFAALLGDVATQDPRNWAMFAAGQIIMGPLAGAAIGLIGGHALLFSSLRSLTSDAFEGIAALALAFLAYLTAVSIGGNGFIAAFVAGLCFGNVVKGGCDFLFEFTEGEGQLLMWAAFLLIGVALVPEAIPRLTPAMLGVILLSLFVVRPVAIWLSLIGTDAAPATRLFFGWFGPRGLATALFALLILPQITGEFAEQIIALAINAVWISALLHGASAVWLGNVYARKAEAMGDCAEKMPMAKPFARPDDLGGTEFGRTMDE